MRDTPPRCRNSLPYPSGFEGIPQPRPDTTCWGHLSQADTHLQTFRERRYWFGEHRDTWKKSGTPRAPFEELHARPFRFRPLRSWLFFNWHQFVAALLGLTVEFRVKSLFARGVSLRPNARIVFHLLLDHRVEDDRDFMGGRRGGPCWS